MKKGIFSKLSNWLKAHVRQTLLVIVIFLLLWVLWGHFTFTFTVLGLFLILLAVILRFVNDENTTFLSSIGLIIFGAACIWTLHNYFYPPEAIFTAVDHHAVKLNGITLRQPVGFQVAGNNNHSFFDSEDMAGSLTIQNVSDTHVTLQATGFTRPIYNCQYNGEQRNTRQTLINSDALIMFDAGQDVVFNAENGSRHVLTITELHGEKKDSTIYTWDADTTAERRFVRQGLPLIDVLAGIDVDSLVLEGITLLRPTVCPLAKRDTLYEALGRHYALAFKEQSFQHDTTRQAALITSIDVGNRRYNLANMHQAAITYDLPYGKKNSIVIGVGEGKTMPVYFERTSQEEGLAINFCMPIYRKLTKVEGRRDVSLFIGTTISGQETKVPEIVTLYDLFAKEDNVNQMQPGYLSYIDGSTQQQMSFSFQPIGQHPLPNGNVKAGEQLPNVMSKNGQVHWQLCIEDFSSTTPVKPKLLLGVLTLCILFMVFLLNVGSWTFEKKERQNADGSITILLNPYTHIEFLVYLAILYLVSIRFFLLWRTSVFPPVGQVSAYEFGLWHETYVQFMWTCIFGGAFLLLMFIIKVLLYGFGIGYGRILDTLSMKFLKWNDDFNRWTVHRIERRHDRLADWVDHEDFASKVVVFLVMFLLSSIVCTALYFVERWGIAILVVYYLLIEIVVGFYYHKAYGEKDYKPAFPFVLSLLNLLMVTATVFLMDSGFGIMLLTFAILWVVYKLFDIFLMSNSNNYSRWLMNSLLALLILALIGVFVMLLYYKPIIEYYYHNPHTFALIGSLLAFAFTFIVCLVLNVRWLTALITSVCIGIVACIGIWNMHGKVFSNHTEQRVLVSILSPVDALRVVSDEATERRFLSASLNDWILDQYNREGQKVAVTGSSGDNYFQLVSHSRNGAMWGAQLTDISLARLIIAEHSGLLPYVLIIIYVLMLLWAISFTCYHRTSRYLLIQIPLLLFVQTLLVWMANTRRFIFFGQDFPMVSITSKFAVFYFFALLLLWVCVALYENREVQDVKDSKLGTGSSFAALAQNSSWVGTITFVSTCAILFFIGFLSGGYDYSKQNGYRLKDLLEESSDYMRAVNDSFAEYQQEVGGVRIRSNMQSYIRQFEDRYHIANSLSSHPFTKHLWENYVRYGSLHNTRQSLLHAHGAKGNMEFSVVEGYYDIKMPSQVATEWRGNVVADGLQEPFCTEGVRLDRRAALTCYHIPAAWSYDEQPIDIIKTDRVRETHVISLSSDKNMTLRARSIRAFARIFETDEVYSTEDTTAIEGLVKHPDYFARSVIINGQRDFVYPLRDYFFWARNFAQEVKRSKNEQKLKLRKPDFNSDIYISIDYTLTRQLFDCLGVPERLKGPRCVVAADGEGRVRAVLDLKEAKYLINPNDNKSIDRIESLNYMEGRRADDRRYFGSMPLQYLDAGPGSSQKPITWAAVASGVNWNEWTNLALLSKNQQGVGIGEFHAKSFGGMGFKYKPGSFRSKGSDESYGQVDVTLDLYMSNSSNFYNGFMAYIGSIPTDSLREQSSSSINVNRIFKRATVQGAPNDFPLVRFGGHIWALNQRLRAEGIQNGLLQQGLRTCFGLAGERDPMIPSYHSETSNSSHRFSSHLYPANSALLATERVGRATDEYDMIDRAVRKTAIGASQVWEVTPFKMAEMYGRLASLSQDYRLTFDTLSAAQFTPWMIDESFISAHHVQMRGMQNVFVNGTARRMNESLHSGVLANYNFYGKTGTIDHPKKYENHRLGVIITNRADRLEDMTPDQLRNLRYYVVFFAADHGAAWSEYQRCLEAIVQSRTFQQYMNRE